MSYCEDGWTEFGDNDKCFRLLEKVATWEEAADFCKENGSNKSTLATIKSQLEQNQILNYLYHQKNTIDNVWIGGRRLNASERFKWIDGSSIEYQSWRRGGPLDDANKNCMQLDSALSKPKSFVEFKDKVGDWENTECERRNFLSLCQMPAFIDVYELAAEFKVLKKQHYFMKDTIEMMQIKETKLEIKNQNLTIILNQTSNLVANLEVENNDLKNEMYRVEKLVNDLNNSVIESFKIINDFLNGNHDFNELINTIKSLDEKVKKGLIPVPENMIYIQYPHELEPLKLWNCSSNGYWKDISKEYANLFFRVGGSESASFDSI